MCSKVREWDIVWVKQTLLQPWWPAVISSARDQPSKGMWQTRVGDRTMYHCTYLAMENKMDWVEADHLKSWEEGRKINHALDMEDLVKRHHEAIELGMKIATDPEKLSEDNAEYYEQIGIKDELAMEVVKQERDVNEPLESIMIESDENEETKVPTDTPKKGVVKALQLQGAIDHETSVDDRTLFVGGLPSSQATKDILATYFGSFGQVEDVHLGSFSGSRLSAVILFRDSSSIEKTKSQTFHEILGHTVIVQKARKGDWIREADEASNNSKLDGRILFVGGLPTTATEEIIKMYFASFGEIEDVGPLGVRIKKSGRNALILYKNSSAIGKAVNHPIHEILGQVVRVKRASKGTKGIWSEGVNDGREDKWKRKRSDGSQNEDLGGEVKKWKRRKFGIERGPRINYQQTVKPPMTEHRSKYRYPHCPGPGRSNGFEDDE